MADLGKAAFEKAVQDVADALRAEGMLEGDEVTTVFTYEDVARKALMVGLPCPFRGADHEPHPWGTGSCDGREVK